MAERERIRIGIAKNWSVPEFLELMSSLQFLRNIALVSSLDEVTLQTILALLEQRESDTKRLDRDDWFSVIGAQFFRSQLQLVFSSVENDYQLEVVRVIYASPGFVDIAGVGKVVEQIRIFLTDIYDRCASRDDRKIARKSAEQDLIAKRIANAEAILKFASLRLD